MIENIQNEIHDLVELAYKEGIEVGEAVGYEDGYNSGLIDAWECAKQIYRMSANELIAIFGSVSGWTNFDVVEAMRKIEEYDRRKKHE
jgi:flagellar biosynthesis/type III secretory pathway protein FliH